MPEANAVFVVKVGIQKVWEFLSDIQSIGTCVPGCEQVRILDNDEAEWVVRAKAGPLSKLLILKTRTVERKPPFHGAFHGRGENFEMKGSVDLKPLAENETLVTYKSSVKASGIIESIINKLAEGQLWKQAEEFANNVKKRLEAP